MLEYKVVGFLAITELATYVNSMLKEGWRLQGGVSQDADRYFMQALVKWTQDENCSNE